MSNFLHVSKFFVYVRRNIGKRLLFMPIVSLTIPFYDNDKYKISTNRLLYNHWGINNREELINVADKLFNEGSYLEVYELLNKIKYSHLADVQWRISRVLFKLATDIELSTEVKENMIMEAYVLMKDTISLGVEDANVYKWMAIILDAHSRMQDTESHVKSFSQIEVYLRKSYELNPNDIVVLYMLGKLCYEMSHLTRMQRLIARILYSTPPTKASYEEAYEFLTKACDDTQHHYYIPSYYLLGKTCKHLKQYFKAKYYFQRAYTMPARNKYEKECSLKAKFMDKFLQDYEISDDMISEFEIKLN